MPSEKFTRFQVDIVYHNSEEIKTKKYLNFA